MNKETKKTAITKLQETISKVPIKHIETGKDYIKWVEK